MNGNYVDQLYEGLYADKLITVSKDEFLTALKNPDYVNSLYEGLYSDKLVTVSKDEFVSSLGGDSMGKKSPLKKGLIAVLEWLLKHLKQQSQVK